MVNLDVFEDEAGRDDRARGQIEKAAADGKGQLRRRIRAIARFGRFTSRWSLLGVVPLLLACVSLTDAQDAKPDEQGAAEANTEAEQRPERRVELLPQRAAVITATYDIRDLLVPVPNFSGAPRLGIQHPEAEQDAGVDNPEEPEQQQTLSREDLIFQTLDRVRQIGPPEDWVASGGDVSSVSELNGNLIVRTTPQNHREIRSLLANLRELRVMQIKIEARLLIVEEAFLEEIGVDVDSVLPEDEDDTWTTLEIAQDTFSVAARQSTGRTGSFGTAVGGTGMDDFDGAIGPSLDIGSSYLDDLQVASLLEKVRALPRAVSLSMPRITIFHGQSAYITTSRQVAYVSEWNPSPDTDKLKPTISVVEAGFALEVEGAVSDDRRYVTLTLQPNLVTLVKMKNAPLEGGPPGAVLETPELERWETEAVVAVPDRGTLMLGSETLKHASIPDGPVIEGPLRVLLLVKPTIIIQTEEEERVFPGLANPDRRRRPAPSSD